MIGTGARTLSGILLGGVAVVGLVACGSSDGSDAKGSTTSSEVPGQSPRPSTPLPRVQVLHETGTGAATTKTFDVAAKWGVAWSFDCGTTGGSGFTLTVLDAGQPVAGESVTKPDASGSGVEHFTSGPGTRALKIETTCKWNVTVGNES